MEKNKNIHVDEQPLDRSKYPCQIYKQSHPLEFPLLLEIISLEKELTKWFSNGSMLINKVKAHDATNFSSKQPKN